MLSTQSLNQQAKYEINDFLFRFHALVIIYGFDSRDNTEYSKLLAWLFEGVSGNQIEESETLDDTYRDFMMLIKKEGAYVYLEPRLFTLIQKYLLAIPNVEIYCPTDKEIENQEELELTKIAQFYKMTQAVGPVGVMLGKKDNKKIANIEKWPMLQAYALEDVGKGFFGMNHQAQDIAPQIKKIYTEHDNYFLRNHLKTTVAQMVSHMLAAQYKLESVKLYQRSMLKEDEINEILQESYEFLILTKKDFIKSIDLPAARTLFGVNTNADFSVKSSEKPLKECGAFDKELPFHFTMEYEDPLSRTRIGRTYFLTDNAEHRKIPEEVRNEEGHITSYKVGKTPNPAYDDEKFCIQLYLYIIDIFRDIVEHCAANLADLNSEYVNKRYCHEFLNIDWMKFNADQIVTHLICFDAYGNEVKPNAFQNQPKAINYNFCILRVQIKDLKSLRDSTRTIGSVLFCDTFYVQSGLYYNLTESIPYTRFFNANGHYSYLWDKASSYACEDLGAKSIDYVENIHLYCPPHSFMADKNMEIESTKVKLKVYEKGFKIYSDLLGLQILLFTDIVNVYFISSAFRPILIIKLKSPLLFNSVSINEISLFFVGTSMHTVFLKLDKLFDQREVKYATLDNLPIYIKNSEELASKNLVKVEREKPIQKNAKIIDKSMLFSYLDYQQTLKMNNLKDLTFKIFYKIVNTKDKEDKSEDKEKQPPAKINFIFVNGTFNAGKRKFSDSLSRYESTMGCRILVFYAKFSELPGISEQSFVQDMMEYVQKNNIKVGDHVVAVIPSVLSTKTIVDGLLMMSEFVEQHSIKAIVTKVNLNNFFQNRHLDISENFLSSCNAGYSQFIILDHFGKEEKELDNYYGIFREMFPSSHVYRISHNILDTNIALDILNYRDFDAKINKLERKRNVPWKGEPRECLFVPFRIPIVKERVEENVFKNLFYKDNGYIYEPINIDASQVTEEDQEVAADLLKVKEMIEKANQELASKVPHMYSVKGYVRYDNQLKEGIYEITVNSNYFIDRLVKNVKTIVKDTGKDPEPGDISYENFDVNNLGLLFYGANLNANKQQILSLLKDLIKPMKEKKKLLTRENLTEQQIKDLEIAHRGWGLGDEIYFDGQYFKDWDGNILPHHPKRDELIEMHLAEENASVGSHNRQIEKEWKAFEQSWN